MLDKRLRRAMQTVLRPLARALGPQAGIGVHPTTLTLIGFVFGVGSAWACARGDRALAAVLFVVNRVFDGVDGAVARMSGLQTDLGGYMDFLCDMTVFALIPVGLAWHATSGGGGGGGAPFADAVWLWLWCALLECTYFVNCVSLLYLSSIFERRALSAAQRGEMTSVAMTEVGGRVLVEGTETVLVYVAMLAFPSLPHIGYIFIFFAAAVAFSVSQRLWWAVRNLDEDDHGSKSATSVGKGSDRGDSRSPPRVSPRR